MTEITQSIAKRIRLFIGPKEAIRIVHIDISGDELRQEEIDQAAMNVRRLVVGSTPGVQHSDIVELRPSIPSNHLN